MKRNASFETSAFVSRASSSRARGPATLKPTTVSVSERTVTALGRVGKYLVAELDAGDLILRWDESTAPDLDKYAVYCDSVSGFQPSVLNFVSFVIPPDTSVNLGPPADTTYYLVSAIDTDGYAGGYSNEVTAEPEIVSGAGDDVVSYRDRLYQNVPNPFNPTTAIRYSLRERARVSIVIYNVAGHMVKKLVGTSKPAGVHTVTWDGRNDQGQRVSSGVYFYKLITGRFTETRKMVMLK